MTTSPSPRFAWVPFLSPAARRRGPLDAHSLRDELVLRALALGEARHRLIEAQALEVRRLRMLGEGRLVLEHLVEEKLRRIFERLVDLKSQHAGLGLGLRQELADDGGKRVDFAGFGFPERGDDQPLLQRIDVSHVAPPAMTASV